MAVTQNSFTGNGSTTQYPFTFPYLKSSEVKAQIDATVTTAFTLANATTVQFNTAPANGAKIKIYRETDDAALAATFYAGSAIKSEDLNDNFTQNLYTTQEVNARYLSNLGGTMVGDMTMAEDVDIIFEGATDDAYETRLTVADPTADRTITLPNVTGTVVTTGDTATVTATMLADNSVNTAELVNSAVTTGKINTSAVTTAKIADDAITAAKIAPDTITDAEIATDAVTATELADNAVDTAAIANDAVTQAKIANDAVGADQLASNSVVSASIVDGTIVTADIADNAITNAKLADDTVGAAELIDTSVGTAALASNAVTLAKMADNSVGTAEIVNDAVTTVKIANNAVTTAKITDSNVTTAKINNDAVTQDKIADDAVGTAQLIDASVNADRIASNAVTTAKIADDAVTSAKIAANAVTTTEIADAELTTLAGMQSGTASILASSHTLTASIDEINIICDGKTVQTTITDSDTNYPTSGAVVDYVAAQIAPLGGLEVIANEDSFPTQPASGVVISIADAGGIVVNGSGVSTTARTAGNGSDNVTINGFPSSLYSTTLAANMGLMVSSTGSNNTYTYHKLLGKEDDIKQLSDDINDFAARYRVASSAPSSSLDDGDLWYDTSNAKMMVYSGTNSAWEEVTSTGDFYINTISSYSGTGGNSATFNGSAYRFVLSNPPTTAQQLIVSINGVIQKPNSGTGQPSEGFALNGSSIVFSAAPATSSPYFIITVGSTVAIGTPSDNTVATAKIQNLAVTGDKIATNLDLADNKKIRFGTGNDLEIFHDGNHSFIKDTGTGNFYITGSYLAFMNAAGSEYMLDGSENGAASLFYDGVNKLQTTSDGVKLPDGQSLTLGDGSDVKLKHQSTHFEINNTSGNTYFQSNGTFYLRGNHSGSTEAMLVGNVGGSVELYYDNVKTFETHSLGIKVSGAEAGVAQIDIQPDEGDDNADKWKVGATDDGHLFISNKDSGAWDTNIECNRSGNVELYYDGSKKLETKSYGIQIAGGVHINSDTQKLWLGADSDLQIYHDGSHSYISDTGTGYLLIKGSEVQIQSSAGEDMAKFEENGSVLLFYNNFKSFNTTDTGIHVWGPEGTDAQIYMYADDGDDNADKWKQVVSEDASRFRIMNYNSGSWETNIECNGDNNVELYYDNSKKLDTYSGGVIVHGELHVASHLVMEDADKIKLGTHTDLEIYHEGDNNFISAGSDGRSGYVVYIENDGNNENRYGIRVKVGADDASGTNYAMTIADGNNSYQGAITFNGGTVTYGTFTAYHPCIVPDSENPSDSSNAYPYGTLLETTSIEYTQKNGANTERGIRYKVQKTQSANSRKVLGAYGSSMNGGPDGQTNEHQALVLGDGHILVNNAGGNIEVGDGICSSATAGIGQKATANPSMIIGIAQEAVTFTGSETKLVAVQYGLQQFIPWT